MLPIRLSLSLPAASLLLCASLTSHADGLADLKGALARLQGQAPVSGALEVKSWRKTGDGKDAQEKQGQANFNIEESARGLQVLYGKELLARADAEDRAKSKDKKAKTPTLYALGEVGNRELRNMTTAAAALSRELEDAVFKTEAADSYNGKPARKLSFEMPLEKLSEEARKYVRKFDTTLDIWIANDGTPLASSLHVNASGRAFVVISFEQRSDEERRYAVVGDRLVLLRKDEKGSSSGAGEKQEYKTTTTLQLAS
ncbi:hypothetical protein [Chitinimonas sp.]|uniref:hypothetical protein n=1 Tax=Chitinimonas sp. TaxID=1934313 RepID=UPI002F92DBD4